jgi:hypothetical protein
VHGYAARMESALTGSAIDASRATLGSEREQPSHAPVVRLTLAALAALGVWLQADLVAGPSDRERVEAASRKWAAPDR